MDRSCPTPLPCRPKPYKTVSFVHKGALCAQNRRFCTEQAAPKAKNSAFATAFREMNHDFYRFSILSHRIELVVRTKPSFSCSVDASMHKTDGFVREALGLCRAPRPERCAAAGNERAAHRAAPRKRPRGRRASRLNAQPAPLPTASPRRPSRHRVPRAASSQPERRSRHRSRRAPKAARPARRSRPQGRRVVPGTPGTPVAAPLRRRGRCRRRTARTTPRSCKWTRFSSCWISRRTRAGRADAPAAQYRRTAPPPGR